MIEMRPATADEMVLVFLQAEIDSPRFSPWLKHWLVTHRFDRATLIDNGLLNDPEQNRRRAELLKGARGYQDNKMLFTGFPDDVQWRLIEIERTELADFKYANEDSLLKVSGTSRLVADGAKNYTLGKAPAHFSERVDGVIGRLNNGEQLCHLIAVEADDVNLVLVEGHTRATAYVVAKPSYPITVLVGTSPLMKRWSFF